MYSSKTKGVLRIKVENFHHSLWLVETKTLNMPIQLHLPHSNDCDVFKKILFKDN